ncbi:MAG: hypothetical protein H0V51_22500 [Chloroflexi bacterium]|nr:hypothetical protein [Chloroflexota bacterium]
MRYELWDTENRNLFYGADTLNEILRAARQALKEGWAREALAIGTDDGSDEPTGWIPEGQALADGSTRMQLLALP